MTEPKVDEGGRTPEQVKKDLQVDRTAPTTGTASGLAALGSPEGKETAKDDHTNSGIQPDAVGPGSPPIGDQTKAAFFTPNGSIPGNSIPSPSGPVPASVIHDEATRNAALETARAGATTARQVGRNSRYRLSEEAAHRVGPAGLRAVAHDRGYQGVEGGRSGVVRKFLDAQAKDDSLEDPPEGHHLGVGSPQLAQPVPGATGATTGNPLATPSQPGGLEKPK